MKTTLEKMIGKYKLKAIPYKEHQDEHLQNNMAIAGDELFLGFYDNEEYELISFFHELGHRLIEPSFHKKWDYNTLLAEIKCWELGIEEARINGIIFSDNAIQWGYNKAMSYVGRDEREYRNWDENTGKKLWVNRRNNR